MAVSGQCLPTWSNGRGPIVAEAVIDAAALSKHYPIARRAGDLFRALAFRTVVHGEVSVAVDGVDRLLNVVEGKGDKVESCGSDG